MRHDQICGLDDVAVVENQIQVERACRARIWALPTKLLFDVEQHGEQVVRREGRVPHRSRVEKHRLLTDANRRRLVEAGRANPLDGGLKCVESRAQVALAIAEIAPEGDSDARNDLLLPARRKDGADTLGANRSFTDDVLEPGGGLLEQSLVFY